MNKVKKYFSWKRTSLIALLVFAIIFSLSMDKNSDIPKAVLNSLFVFVSIFFVFVLSAVGDYFNHADEDSGKDKE